MPINGPTAWFKIGSIFPEQSPMQPNTGMIAFDQQRKACQNPETVDDPGIQHPPQTAVGQGISAVNRRAGNICSSQKLDQGSVWSKGDDRSRIPSPDRFPLCFKLAGSCFTGQKLKRIALEFLSNFLGCSFIFGFIPKPEDHLFSRMVGVDILSKNPRLDFRCR